MSSQLQVTGEAKVRDIQGPVVANSGVITALDGDASQYVRGDGTLADFPTSTGGGSSVSYYLNSSVSQGTIGGVAYRQLGKTPIIGAGTDITISANGYVASYITDANDPALLEVPAGNFNCEFYFSVNSNSHNPFVYAEVYKYDGTTFTLIGTSVGVPEYLSNGTTLSPYYFAIPVSTSVLTVTDRISIRIYVNVDGRTVTLHTENGHLCQVVTTFSKGLTSLNNLTRQVQFLATGTSGTDFGISSSVATHTFNLPIASASNTGKLSSTDWSTFNNKLSTATAAATYVPYTGATANIDLGLNDLNARFVFTEGGGGIGPTLGFLQTAYASVSTTNHTNIYVQNNNIIGFTFYQPSAFTKDFRFDVSGLDVTTIRTYTMPNASGTIALTSNLSAYLPLTGGILTGTTRMDGSGGTTEPISMIFNTGINRLLAPVLRLFGATNVGSNYVELFGSLATQNRTINFPDASGTVALTSDIPSLAGYVPYTGATTNVDLGTNSITLFNITSNNVLIVKNTGSVTGTNGFSSFSGNLANNGFTFAPNNSSYHRFIVPTSSNYDYTLPAASGTLALTSNLSAYLPLAGGTLTGALGGTSAVFSSSVSASSLDASQIINKQAGTSPSFALIRNVSGYATWLGIDGNNDFNIFDNDATSLAFSVRVNTNRGQITAPFYGGSSNVIIGSNNSGTLTKMVIGSGLSFDGTTLTVPLSNYLPLSGGVMSGQIVLKESTNSSDYTKGLRFPNNPYGGGLDVSGLRLYSDTGENMILELYVGNDNSFAAEDKINFATGVGGTPNNDFVTINGNKIWNAGNLTPQVQLNGTGFVKASGTTISYDNTSYLPYTGATANVNLGIYGLTSGGLTIAKNGSAVSGLIFEQAAGLGLGGSGFTTIGPTGSDRFGFYFGGATQSFVFNASSITSQRSYTLPDASGTLALLSGTQTFSGATTFSSAITMGAYSFASSAIQFTRANTNTVSPGSGNGILVFAGGNAQMRMDTSNGINFDMFNGGSAYTVLKLQQNGNTVLIDSPNNTLSLGLGYQGTMHGYLGGFSSRLEAFSTNGGYVYLSNGSAWIPASDVKRKRNFETYSLGLDAILGLKPKRYNMDFQKDGDEKQVGLVAQEVKEHIPQAFEQSEDFIGINYNVIIVTLVNAIQELKAEIDILKNK